MLDEEFEIVKRGVEEEAVLVKIFCHDIRSSSVTEFSEIFGQDEFRLKFIFEST